MGIQASREHNLDNVVKAAQLASDRVDRSLWHEMTDSFEGALAPDEVKRIDSEINSHPMMVAEFKIEAAQLGFLYECEELTEDVVAQLLALECWL